jgi:heat shock protein HtpX
MNNTRTFVLLAAMTALLLVLGNLLGGHAGLMIALFMAFIMNVGSYWFSDSIVLKMYKAQPLDASHPVCGIVEELAQNARTPVPKAYLVNDMTPNAFATGRNPSHAAIAVTQGLLDTLSKEELTGVLAHEMAHIVHRDTLIGTVSATIAGAISSFANIFMWTSAAGQDQENRPNPLVAMLMVFLAPIAAGLIQMAISRSREFEADRGGAEICKKPLWLASALAKLENANRKSLIEEAETHPATAHIFTVNPLHGAKLTQMFATHPPIAERIRRLEAMAASCDTVRKV